MNKFEELFQSILEQTRTGEIEWRQLRRSELPDVIFNPNLVFRQFVAEFVRNGEKFLLYFLEKKHDDFDYPGLDKYYPELTVLDADKELIVTLTDSVIDHQDMISLAQSIERKNDRASKLFG